MHSPAVAKDAHSRPFYGLLGTDTMNIIFSSVILIFFISLGRYFYSITVLSSRVSRGELLRSVPDRDDF